MAKFIKTVANAEALERLDRAFQPKAGDLITYDAMRAVVGFNDERHFRYIVAAWIRILRRRGLKPTGSGRARGVGIYFLTGIEDAAEIDHRFGLEGKRLKRLAVRTADVDTTGFTPAQIDRHELRKRLTDAARREVERNNRELNAPPPVSGDNVRTLRRP